MYVRRDSEEIASSPLIHIPTPLPITTHESQYSYSSYHQHPHRVCTDMSFQDRCTKIPLLLPHVPSSTSLHSLDLYNFVKSYCFYQTINHLLRWHTYCRMAAMVQSFPSPTSTITMLQTRPSSSEAFQTGSQGQQHQRNNQIPRNMYNTSVGGMAAGNYRGHTSTSPVSPYAFTGTPILQNGQSQNPLRQHPTGPQPPRLENRTNSAPSLPVTLQASQQSMPASSRPRPPVITPSSTPLNASTVHQPQLQPSKDDSSISTLSSKQSNTRLDLNPPTLPPATYATVAKSSPDRYRRNHRRAETSGALTSNTTHVGSAMPSGSGMAAVGQLYTHPNQTSSTPTLTSYPSYRGTQPSSPIINDYSSSVQPRLSKDDINLQRERQAQADLAKRYRRRSISSLEAKDYAIPLSAPPTLVQQPAQPKTYAAMLAGPAPQAQERREVRTNPSMERPTSSHGRNSSNESSSSGPSTSQPVSKTASVR